MFFIWKPSNICIYEFVCWGFCILQKKKIHQNLISIHNSFLFREWHKTTILISDTNDYTSSHTHNPVMMRTKIPIQETKPPLTPTKTFCRSAVMWIYERPGASGLGKQFWKSRPGPCYGNSFTWGMGSGNKGKEKTQRSLWDHDHLLLCKLRGEIKQLLPTSHCHQDRYQEIFRPKFWIYAFVNFQLLSNTDLKCLTSLKMEITYNISSHLDYTAFTYKTNNLNVMSVL